jgi:osmoprotectant transport system substrate-binding protein
MKSLRIALALLLVIAVTGVVFAAPIKIGTKNFTEQFVVGNLMSILLENRGYDVQLKTGMSSTVMRAAMESGLYWDPMVDLYRPCIQGRITRGDVRKGQCFR